MNLEPLEEKQMKRGWKLLTVLFWVIVVMCVAVLVASLVSGCVEIPVKEPQIKANVGFQPLPDAKLTIDIDNKEEAGGDLDKSVVDKKEVKQEQSVGVQYQKSVETDVYAIVIFFLGYVFIREFASYMRMRLKN